MNYDGIKRIVMGEYYKYEEDSDWFSHAGTVGEVRVIEGILCHAVTDIEYYDEPVFNPCNNTEVDSKKVIRWEPYDCTK